MNNPVILFVRYVLVMNCSEHHVQRRVRLSAATLHQRTSDLENDDKMTKFCLMLPCQVRPLAQNVHSIYKILIQGNYSSIPPLSLLSRLQHFDAAMS